MVTRRLEILLLFFFLILQDFPIQKGDYERLFKGVHALRGNKVATTSPPK
jgi:hypothetical protein